MYAILYRPDNEYVSFDYMDTPVLFCEDEESTVNALNDILYSNGSYDGEPDDFAIVIVDTKDNGAKYVAEATEFIPVENIK